MKTISKIWKQGKIKIARIPKYAEEEFKVGEIISIVKIRRKQNDRRN